MAILMRDGNANAMLRFFVKTGRDFELTCSNYTMQLQTDTMKTKYVNSMQSNRTFAAFAKVKSNIKDKPVPYIDRDALRYFQHDFKTDMVIPTVYNIDLKSAYASILFNDGFITKETRDYLGKCKKEERLAGVGMLASKKHIFNFKNGKATAMNMVESPTANFFYHTVKRTDEIMSVLKMLTEDSYLFTWVDGIYFSDKDKADSMFDYLQSIGMLCSFETLENFHVRIYKKKCVVNFYKQGKRKEFNLPSQHSNFKTMLSDAMRSLNDGRAKKQQIKNHNI